MTDEYRQLLEEGNKFEYAIAEVFAHRLGIILTPHTTKETQLIGENKQGIEIKLDRLINKTGNIYIETEEKSDKANLNYAPSGIYRNDNTWLYVIGNMVSKIYIFGKRILQGMDRTKKYKAVEIATSRGFLLPVADGEKYALKILFPLDTITAEDEAEITRLFWTGGKLSTKGTP